MEAGGSQQTIHRLATSDGFVSAGNRILWRQVNIGIDECVGKKIESSMDDQRVLEFG